MAPRRTRAWGSPGRVRIVLTILLALLIGAAGAILLPRIVQEDPPEGDARRGTTTLTPREGLLAAAGTLRLTAEKAGLPDLDLEVRLSDGLDQAAIVSAVSDALSATSWVPGTDYVVSAEGVQWIDVRALAGSTTIPNLTVSVALE